MNFLRGLRHLFRRKEAFLALEHFPENHPLCPLSQPEQDWACTDDFQQIAKHHCFSVCICNLLLCLFREEKLKKEQLFPLLHRSIGNGPIFSMKKAEHFFRQENIPVQIQVIHDTAQLKAVLYQEQVCPLLLALRPWSWHWVLAVGYLELEGNCYLLILDGWHKNLRLYHLQKGSEFLAAWAVKPI